MLLLILIGAVHQSTSSEKSFMAKAMKRLPSGASLTLDKRVSGKSRKGVVTYYSHFVLATFTHPENESMASERFPFNHHDEKDKENAVNKAVSWLVEQSQVTAVSTSLDTDGQSEKVTNPSLAKRTDRYGRTIN